MSIALQRMAEMQRRPSELGISAACVATAAPSSSLFESSAKGDDREEVNECSPSSSETSSIGKNSDLSGERESCDGDENEVQSEFKGTSLDSMAALQECLPVRNAISKFYAGKSKSFTSLAEAASASSIKDIAKPENPYTRKRRNLLAHNLNHVGDNKNRHRSNGGGICKRAITTSRSTLALAVAMGSSESINSATSEDSNSTSSSRSPPPLHHHHHHHHLPPLYPGGGRGESSHHNLASPPSPRQQSSPWRSFSMADLQHCASTATATTTTTTNLH